MQWAFYVISGESITIWSLSSLLDKECPELKIELIYQAAKSGDKWLILSQKKVALTAGKSCYYNAEWYGEELRFKSNIEPHIFVKASGTDTNYASKLDTTTTLSKALKMMEEVDNFLIATGTYMKCKKCCTV